MKIFLRFVVNFDKIFVDIEVEIIKGVCKIDGVNSPPPVICCFLNVKDKLDGLKWQSYSFP